MMLRGLAVATAALALVGVAAAAPTGTVAVSDSALSPQLVAVDSGGSVTWRNRGRRPHRIASRSGAFAAFTLAPRRTRTIRFARDGRHPYTVDGRRCGVVFAGVPLGAGCVGGASSARPSTGTRIHRYDVTLQGYIKNDGFVDSNGRREQTWVRELSWTSTFRNFRFRVVRGGPYMIGINHPAGHRTSTARVVESWDYFWHPHALFAPNADCDGTTTVTIPYRAAVAAANRGNPNFYVLGQAHDGWNPDDTIAGDCNSWTPPSWVYPEFVWEGISLDPDVGTLGVNFDRDGNGFRLPVAELLTGAGFTLDTGVHRHEQTTCEGSCSGTVKIEQRYVAIFRPRR